MNRRKFLSLLGAAPFAAPAALAAQDPAIAATQTFERDIMKRALRELRGAPLFDIAAWNRLTYRVMPRWKHLYKMWIGVDIPSSLDMAAIGGVAELPDGRITVFADYFMPADSDAAGHLVDKPHIWNSRSGVFVTPGQVVDHDIMRRYFAIFCSGTNVQEIACDPYQAHNAARHLWGDGLPVSLLSCNAKTLTGSVNDMRRRIIEGTLEREPNSVLDWNVANARAHYYDDGGVVPVKEAPDSLNVINGVTAIVMANAARLASKTP